MLNKYYKTVNCPGTVIFTEPPHMHIHISPPHTTDPVDKSACGLLEIQGDDIAGTHGIGVNVKTPNAAAVAAAVAAATVGFAMVVHIPKDKTFIIGIKSAMQATGIPEAKTGVLGITMSDEGAIPQEHLQSAPQTATGITKL